VVQITPRFVVNGARAAIDSAVEGRGVTRLLSYQVAEVERDSRLQMVLKSHEYPPLPVHLIMPEGRITIPKGRVRGLCRAVPAHAVLARQYRDLKLNQARDGSAGAAWEARPRYVTGASRRGDDQSIA